MQGAVWLQYSQNNPGFILSNRNILWIGSNHKFVKQTVELITVQKMRT